MIARRSLMKYGLASLALPALPAWARQDGGPAFPPVDENSVWLVGDSAPPDARATATRLAELVEARGEVLDSYLHEGAVTQLETAFATMLGKEDCAFFPTGTMANQVAIRVLAGDHPRAIVQQDSHVYRDESDAAQRMSSINLVPLAPGKATPTLDEFAAAFDQAENGPYPLRIGAVSIESPVRRARGEMVPIDMMRQIAALSREHGARLHLDGARILLAPPAFDLPAYSGLFDTVYVSLYKYLGAPFGAVLAGDRATIEQAREWRHLFGGLIYQGWGSALLALDALDTFPAQIADAHRAAQSLFGMLEASGKVRVAPNPDASNIYRLEADPALGEAAFERGRVAGVRIGRFEDGNIAFFVNTTLLRRPVEEYARIILG
ncbi:MAG: amino acid lyase [Sphingomonas sp.]|nr:amino acid lyase [Sphingomonas sp.]